MFLLRTVQPEEATGRVAEAYGVFPPQMGVPMPLQLMSASPDLLACQIESIKYSMRQQELSFPLLASIRYLAARRLGYDYCIALNGSMLERQGVTPEELSLMAENPAQAPLEMHETAMLRFVAKALDAPQDVGEDDVQALRDMGWSETAIFDALSQGANMVGPSILFKALSKK